MGKIRTGIKMKDILDRTDIPKAVKVGDYIVMFNPIGEGIVRVIETYSKICFNVNKNIAKLSNSMTFVNTEDGLKASGLTIWMPEIEKFIVVKTSSTNEYQVKRVKDINTSKKEVLLYDNTTLRFNEVQPFYGKFI